MNYQLELGTLITFGLLFAAIALVWSKAKPLHVPTWCWLFIASIGSALFFNIITPVGVMALSVLTALVVVMEWFVVRRSAPVWLSLLFYLGLIVVFVTLGLHLVPGFNNPKILDPQLISNSSIEYHQYLNFDKAAAGLLLFGFIARRQSSVKAALQSIVSVWWIYPIALAATFGTAFVLGLNIDIFFTSTVLIFFAINLFTTCVAEECFTRSLIQQPLSTGLKVKYAPYIALTISAIIFSLLHFQSVELWQIPALVFIAGWFYGFIYHRTGSIEASIVLHFLVNAVHIGFFVYPMAF